LRQCVGNGGHAEDDISSGVQNGQVEDCPNFQMKKKNREEHQREIATVTVRNNSLGYLVNDRQSIRKPTSELQVIGFERMRFNSESCSNSSCKLTFELSAN